MTAKALPRKLGKEPLVDVVCEVRFETELPASSLLLGMMLQLATNKPSIETLPIAQIPQMVRENDPNLRYAPLMRMSFNEKFVLLFSDRSVAVGCVMPYPGWTEFKAAIVSVFSVLGTATFIKKIDRHSLKYVDFFPMLNGAKPTLERFNVVVDVAGRQIVEQSINLRVEMVEAPFIHAAGIVSPALIQRSDNSSSSGAVIDVDTHRVHDYSVQEFLSAMPRLLDEIHAANKSYFFDLLSERGLAELEPQYE